MTQESSPPLTANKTGLSGLKGKLCVFKNLKNSSSISIKQSQNTLLAKQNEQKLIVFV
jgi:hypothetical protein